MNGPPHENDKADQPKQVDRETPSSVDEGAGISFADEHEGIANARAIVVHPALKSGARTQRREPEARLAEAVSLTAAINLEVIEASVVLLGRPRPATLLGHGKIEELAGLIAARDVDVLVVDGTLSPIQQRNLEREVRCKVIDRTGLILEIFGERARTKEGRLQVDLAHLSYQKSRLVRSWTHLERQRGGAGFMGGPGETQREADRRTLQERIERIERELKTVTKTRTLHRKGRKKVPYPIVALVGYTNAGKSTLFNRMTAADVMAKDMLFATLDPTLRSIELKSGRKVILSDTVGFISDLPTELVAAFRATLEEVLEADIVVHVRDIASPHSDAECADVIDVLKGLGLDEARFETMIEVQNKIDLLDDESANAVKAAADRKPGALAVSAFGGEGVEQLHELLDARLGEQDRRVWVRCSTSHGALLAALYDMAEVEQTQSVDDETMRVLIRASDAAIGKLQKQFDGFKLDPVKE